MEYQLFAKAGEGGSQVLQMKYSGKHSLMFLQINSLDFNANKTKRKGTCEHITVKSEVIFHSDLIAKRTALDSKRQHHKHLGFSHMDGC